MFPLPYARLVSSPFALIVSVIILYELSEQVRFSAHIRLFEDAVCQRYYWTRGNLAVPVDEQECKVAAVQQSLAFIRGWYSFWSTAPGKRMWGEGCIYIT